MTTLRHYCGEIVHAVMYEDGNAKTWHSRFDRDCLEPITNCRLCKKPLHIDWCGDPWLIEPMPYRMMLRTRKLNCSNCWGRWLKVDPVDVEIDEETGETERQYMVYCEKCLEETVGFVSDGFIRWQLTDDHFKFLGVKITLGVELGLFAVPKIRDEEEVLAEMGF